MECPVEHTEQLNLKRVLKLFMILTVSGGLLRAVRCFLGVGLTAQGPRATNSHKQVSGCFYHQRIGMKSVVGLTAQGPHATNSHNPVSGCF